MDVPSSNQQYDRDEAAQTSRGEHHYERDDYQTDGSEGLAVSQPENSTKLSADAKAAFSVVAVEMLQDEDVDVDLSPEGLLVHGKLFAFPRASGLVVELPAERAQDLRARGVAEAFDVDGQVSRTWVRVSDRELWSELAREAHQFVGEPPVGRQS